MGSENAGRLTRVMVAGSGSRWSRLPAAEGVEINNIEARLRSNRQPRPAVHLSVSRLRAGGVRSTKGCSS
jgi:hypothetical protein